jgi:hypothetical protein
MQQVRATGPAEKYVFPMRNKQLASVRPSTVPPKRVGVEQKVTNAPTQCRLESWSNCFIAVGLHKVLI